MTYKVMTEKGELIEWIESSVCILVEEWLPTKIGPKKVVMVGMLEYDTSTKKPYFPIWTRQ